MQFYSSCDNIGNYLPVLGIQKLLSIDTDTWCIHDENIDFDFINKHYKGAIIGGAGLLHKCFEPFWVRLGRECKLPMVVWGVGGCFPDDQKEKGVNPKIAAKALNRCDLINVRDDVTAEFYKLSKAHISPCPTIACLRDFKTSSPKRTKILFSSHEELVSEDETESIKSAIQRIDRRYKYTNNIQRFHCGVNDIIKRYYCKSNLVVTTRLHGAIIAYALSIPYVAIPRDEKLRSFKRLFSNGVILENIGDLENLLVNEHIGTSRPIEIKPVLEFGHRVQDWVNSLTNY